MFVWMFMRFPVVLLFFVVIGISIYPIYGQTSSTSATFNNFGPITNYSTALTDSFDSSHARKGARYDINDSQVPELGEDSEPNLFDLPRSHTSKALAASDYDTIVVGIVTAGQSYLSNDKRNIYSEFKIALQEVIKGSALGLVAGQSIDIERSGGAIRLRSGKILQRGSLTESMPQVGKRYAFILQSKEDTGFILKTGYQLEGAHVFCLDDDKKSAGALNHPLKEHGGTENQLIEQLKKSVSSARGGN